MRSSDSRSRARAWRTLQVPSAQERGQAEAGRDRQRQAEAGRDNAQPNRNTAHRRCAHRSDGYPCGESRTRARDGSGARRVRSSEAPHPGRQHAGVLRTTDFRRFVARSSGLGRRRSPGLDPCPQSTGQATGAGGVRIVSCYLPVKNPWLHPIAPKWVHSTRALVEPDRRLSAQELADRVCTHFDCSHEAHLTIPDTAA